MAIALKQVGQSGEEHLSELVHTNIQKAKALRFGVESELLSSKTNTQTNRYLEGRGESRVEGEVRLGFEVKW